MAKQKQEQKTKEAVEAMERAETIRASVREAVRAVDRSYLELADGLAEIYHQKYFETWGFTNFESYCTSELDFTYRKAKFLIEIWDKVQGYNISRDRIERIGWTKMKDIVKVMNDENYEEWLQRAEEMSVSQLSAQLSELKVEGSSGTTVVRLRMNAAEAAIIMEAVEAAKKLVNSDNDVSALEMICQDWMEAHGHSPEKVSLEQHLAYLNKVYGVNVVAMDLEDAPEDAAEQVQAENVTEEKEPQGIEDLLDGPGKKEDVVEKAEPANEQDIDAILGMI